MADLETQLTVLAGRPAGWGRQLQGKQAQLAS